MSQDRATVLHPGQQSENLSQNKQTNKQTKISWASWCVPVIPATQEAEAGELLEPGRWRLHSTKIVPLYSSLSDTQDSVSKRKKSL